MSRGDPICSNTADQILILSVLKLVGLQNHLSTAEIYRYFYTAWQEFQAFALTLNTLSALQELCLKSPSLKRDCNMLFTISLCISDMVYA